MGISGWLQLCRPSWESGQHMPGPWDSLVSACARVDVGGTCFLVDPLGSEGSLEWERENTPSHKPPLGEQALPGSVSSWDLSPLGLES